MITFVLLAAALTVASVAAVAIPLLRRSETASAPWTALAAAGLLVVGSVALYLTWSNWPWRAPPAADSPANMVSRLARRLEQDPNDVDGWLMLGRSYTVLQEYPLAARAFGRAVRLSDGKNAEALAGEGEALALSDESELDGRAGRLFEQALALEPRSAKALFFGAAVDTRRGDLPLARERFAKLLELDPPQAIRPMIEQQITAIDEKLSGAAGSTAAVQQVQPRKPDSTPMGPQQGTPVVRVNVTLAPSLASAAGAAPLFVFVRDPSQAGPPLAVKRLESHFPQSVELSPADSIMPGRAFSPGQSVQVVARIARSGNPRAATGDPFGEVSYKVGSDGEVSLVINRLTP